MFAFGFPWNQPANPFLKKLASWIHSSNLRPAPNPQVSTKSGPWSLAPLVSRVRRPQPATGLRGPLLPEAAGEEPDAGHEPGAFSGRRPEVNRWHSGRGPVGQSRSPKVAVRSLKRRGGEKAQELFFVISHLFLAIWSPSNWCRSDHCFFFGEGGTLLK